MTREHASRPPLQRQGNARLQQAADRAQRFLDRYGIGRALVLAGFVPLVRTVITPLDGITRVPLRALTLWQAVGGVVCTTAVLLTGYACGSSISNVDRHLLTIVALVCLIQVAVQLPPSRRPVETSGPRWLPAAVAHSEVRGLRLPHPAHVPG